MLDRLIVPHIVGGGREVFRDIARVDPPLERFAGPEIRLIDRGLPVALEVAGDDRANHWRAQFRKAINAG